MGCMSAQARRRRRRRSARRNHNALQDTRRHGGVRHAEATTKNSKGSTNLAPCAEKGREKKYHEWPPSNSWELSSHLLRQPCLGHLPLETCLPRFPHWRPSCVQPSSSTRRRERPLSSWQLAQRSLPKSSLQRQVYTFSSSFFWFHSKRKKTKEMRPPLPVDTSKDPLVPGSASELEESLGR